MSATSTLKDPLSPPRPPQREQQDYHSGLRWSFGIHFLLVALIIVKSLIFPGTAKRFIPTLRVDIVGLPDVLKKDLGSVPKETSSLEQMADALTKAQTQIQKAKENLPRPEAIKKVLEKAAADELVLKPKKAESDSKSRQKKIKGALARIKALERITAETTPTKKVASGILIKGNKVSKGSSLSGDARESNEANYYDALRGRLQDNWALPVWLARQNLSAQVQIFIDGRGKLRTFRFLKLSGNSQFDSAVKQCLKESEPFPLPPEGMASSSLIDGILVGFPL